MSSLAAFKARISAAEGYFELGMPLEANEEFEQIDADQRFAPRGFGFAGENLQRVA